jgi:hypothetical protein
VNGARAEITQDLQNPGVVPQEKKIEFVMTVQRKLDGTAAQLHPSDRTVGHDFVTRAGVHQQEGESVFLREFSELPAGIRDAVNFAVGARKQRHPDFDGIHATTSRRVSRA